MDKTGDGKLTIEDLKGVYRNLQVFEFENSTNFWNQNSQLSCRLCKILFIMSENTPKFYKGNGPKIKLLSLFWCRSKDLEVIKMVLLQDKNFRIITLEFRLL